jgi:hypothetical protein
VDRFGSRSSLFLGWFAFAGIYLAFAHEPGKLRDTGNRRRSFR